MCKCRCQRRDEGGGAGRDNNGNDTDDTDGTDDTDDTDDTDGTDGMDGTDGTDDAGVGDFPPPGGIQQSARAGGGNGR